MFSEIVKLYNELEDLADPKVRKWFLMNSTLLPISIVVFYLYFVLVLGPKLMKNRKAFDINRVIVIYNVVQVIFNAYLFKHTCENMYRNLDSFRCFKVQFEDTEDAYIQRTLNWLFTLNKLMDLLDTIFFVMKKKQSHVSFLHVYHHVLTFSGCWAMAKYYPGGQLVIIGVLNSFVHCVMYSYYLFSMGDRFKKVTNFVKKRITQMQITQFFLAALHSVYSVTDPSCDYPQALMYFGMLQAVVLTILFVDFYRKAYLKSRKVDQQLQNGYLKNGTVKKAN